jgi:uncharacterized protein YndB with AHSA1/START domain
MTKRAVTHATFTIERIYAHPVAKVFAAFADPKAKARWFVGPPGWNQIEATMDFRVGGRETNRGGPPDGVVHGFDATYQDIVPNERIIFTYDMHLGETPISVSLTTIQFKAEGKSTRLTFTEQGAFLDAFDDAAGREQGTRELLTALGHALDAGEMH